MRRAANATDFCLYRLAQSWHWPMASGQWPLGTDSGVANRTRSCEGLLICGISPLLHFSPLHCALFHKILRFVPTVLRCEIGWDRKEFSSVFSFELSASVLRFRLIPSQHILDISHVSICCQLSTSPRKFCCARQFKVLLLFLRHHGNHGTAIIHGNR